MPAFAGHVPVAFKRIFPNSTFTTVERWNRFPDEFCCPLYIDPIDPLFDTIGKLFLKEIVKQYGDSNHIYFSDPFNEVDPHTWTTDYLGSVSSRIYQTMRAVDEKSVWLLQGWMFVHNNLWTSKLMKAFLTSVPKGRILVLDLQAEQFPQYNRTSSFYGQPFIWCMLHNFGGTLGMHGSLNNVNEVKLVLQCYTVCSIRSDKIYLLYALRVLLMLGNCRARQWLVLELHQKESSKII